MTLFGTQTAENLVENLQGNTRDLLDLVEASHEVAKKEEQRLGDLKNELEDLQDDEDGLLENLSEESLTTIDQHLKAISDLIDTTHNLEHELHETDEKENIQAQKVLGELQELRKLLKKR